MGVQWYSGFHSHNVPLRDPGRLEPLWGDYTDSSGCAYGEFFATDVAGVHEVQAFYGSLVDTLYVSVMVYNPYLQWLPNHSTYQKVGTTPEHPTNFYGTFNAVSKIQTICSTFYNETRLVAGVNDMSLPWGGRFDLGPAYGGQWWHPPHHEHMWGLNADFPYQYLGTPTQRQRFRDIASANGGNPQTEDNHYHLKFSH